MRDLLRADGIGEKVGGLARTHTLEALVPRLPVGRRIASLSPETMLVLGDLLGVIAELVQDLGTDRLCRVFGDGAETFDNSGSDRLEGVDAPIRSISDAAPLTPCSTPLAAS